MPSLYCTRTWFAGRRESNLRLSDQKSKVLHGVFRIKKSGNVLAPNPCWKWIICPDIYYQPPHPLRIKWSTTKYPLHRRFDSWKKFCWIWHPPPSPCIWGDIFIPSFTVNDNGHWWMKNIWPKFRQKKSAFEMCRPPPPPPPSIRWLLIT